MKKDLVVFALICSLACTIVSPLARNVSAVESKGNSSSSSNEEWDPDYNESNVNPDRKKKYGLDGSTSNPEAETIAETIISVLTGIVGVVSVGMIIWGGIMYSMSAGDPGKTQLAKRIIITAIIGLALSILAYLIIRTVFRVITEGQI